MVASKCRHFCSFLFYLIFFFCFYFSFIYLIIYLFIYFYVLLYILLIALFLFFGHRHLIFYEQNLIKTEYFLYEKTGHMSVIFEICNRSQNIFELVDILPNVSFATCEKERDY